jgi:hypothetical protein
MKLNWGDKDVNFDYETFAKNVDIGDIILGIDHDSDRWAAIKTNKGNFVTIAANEESTIPIGTEETLEQFIDSCSLYRSKVFICLSLELNVRENFFTETY